MPYYRFYFTDKAKSIVGHATKELNDDNSAAIHADKLLAGSLHPSVEVWNGPRLLHQKTKDEAARDK
jgi:hypothetical protein